MKETNSSANAIDVMDEQAKTNIFIELSANNADNKATESVLSYTGDGNCNGIVFILMDLQSHRLFYSCFN